MVFYKRKNKGEDNPPRDYPSNVYKLTKKWGGLRHKSEEKSPDDNQTVLLNTADRIMDDILSPIIRIDGFSEYLRWSATFLYPIYYIFNDIIGSHPSGSSGIAMISTMGAADILYNRYRKKKIAKETDEIMWELNELEKKLGD